MGTSKGWKALGSCSSRQKNFVQNIASNQVLEGENTDQDNAGQLLDHGISVKCSGLMKTCGNTSMLTWLEGMPQSLVTGFADLSDFYQNLAREAERQIEDGNLSCDNCDMDEGYGDIVELLELLAAKGEIGKMLAATFYVKFAGKILRHITCRYEDEIRYQQMAFEIDEIDYLLCSLLKQKTRETILMFEAEIYPILILFENDKHPHWLRNKVLAYCRRENFQQPFFLRSLTLLRHRNNERVARLLANKVVKSVPPTGLPQELVDLVELYLIEDGSGWWEGKWLESDQIDGLESEQETAREVDLTEIE